MIYEKLSTERLFELYADECKWRHDLGEHVTLNLPFFTALSIHSVLQSFLRSDYDVSEVRKEITAVLAAIEPILNRTPAIAEALRRGNDPKYDEIANGFSR